MLFVVFFLMAVLTQTPPPAPAQTPARPPSPCETAPAYRQLDFWIGDWTVEPAGAPAGRPRPQSKIEKILGGCVILENWLPPAGSGGKSFNVFNAQTKKWEQHWVDSVGTIAVMTGELRDGNMHYERSFTSPAGQKVLARMTFFNLGPDRVRQLVEQSTDGGKTWAVQFDAMYTRKKS